MIISNIRWDDNLKYKLANATMKYRGYTLDDKNTKNSMRMETKWEQIRDYLLNDKAIDESFKNNPPSAKSLQTSFSSFLKEVLKAVGISEEVANLPGLEETPTEYQQLSAKRFENDKKKKKKRLILTLSFEPVSLGAEHLLQTIRPLVPQLTPPLSSCSSLSYPTAILSTVDTSDFYLNSKLKTPTYLRVPLRFLPSITRSWLKVDHLPTDSSILFEVYDAIYGMDDAGRVSQ